MSGARALVLMLVSAAASLTAAAAATATLQVAFADQEGQVVSRKAPAARPNYVSWARQRDRLGRREELTGVCQSMDTSPPRGLHDDPSMCPL